MRRDQIPSNPDKQQHQHKRHQQPRREAHPHARQPPKEPHRVIRDTHPMCFDGGSSYTIPLLPPRLIGIRTNARNDLPAIDPLPLKRRARSQTRASWDKATLRSNPLHLEVTRHVRIPRRIAHSSVCCRWQKHDTSDRNPRARVHPGRAGRAGSRRTAISARRKDLHTQIDTIYLNAPLDAAKVELLDREDDEQLIFRATPSATRRYRRPPRPGRNATLARRVPGCRCLSAFWTRSRLVG